MFFLTFLMQMENLLAQDGHQKIFGPPEHLTNMSSYFEGCPGILWFSLRTRHQGIVHIPLFQI